MILKKLFVFGLMAAVLPAFAEEAADRKTATSLKYVEHELDTRQNKFTAEQNKAMEYTDSAGIVQQRTVKSDLGSNTSDTSLPMVGGVNTKLATKQDDIAPINDHTAVTYTGTAGKIGAKGIYQATESYVEQSNNLIDAKTFNAALKRGLDSEFLCSEYKPGTDLCWVWSIHNSSDNPIELYAIEQGNINASDGQPSSNFGEKRVRTGFINVEPNTQYTISSGGLSYSYVYQYSSNGSFLGAIGAWVASPRTVTTGGSAGKIRILLANSDSAGTSTEITPDDVSWLQVEPGATATPRPYTTLVPAGYTPVEWIESTGTQYIDTGIYITSNNIVAKAKVNKTSTSTTEQDIFGNQDNTTYRTVMGAGPNRWFLYTRSGTAAAPTNVTIAGTNNVIVNLEGHIENGQKWLVLDGVVSEPQIATAIANSNKTVQVLADGSSKYNFVGRLYNFSLSDDGVEVCNLIPARRNSDNVLGMYDTVNNVFKTNAATSGNDFTAGPDINNIIYVPQGQN